MAMALRTMAAKLGQKVVSSVKRVAKSSRAQAKTSSPFAGLKNVDPGVRRDLEELMMLHRKMDRDTYIAQATGAGLGLLHLGIYDSSGSSSPQLNFVRFVKSPAELGSGFNMDL